MSHTRCSPPSSDARSPEEGGEPELSFPRRVVCPADPPARLGLTTTPPVLGPVAVPMPDAARERIIACTDRERLDAWVRRAATARAVDELLA